MTLESAIWVRTGKYDLDERRIPDFAFLSSVHVVVPSVWAPLGLTVPTRLPAVHYSRRCRSLVLRAGQKPAELADNPIHEAHHQVISKVDRVALIIIPYNESSAKSSWA